MVFLLNNNSGEDAVKRIEDVGVGKVVVTRENIVLRAIALGSCIGVSAYDPVEKIGGMAHIMLPGEALEQAPDKTRYAADAIDKMVGQMIEAGSKLCDLEVCLVGAGNVLDRDDDTICQSNIDSVRRILEDKGIDVKATALGGTQRRSVSVDIESGDIFYTEGNSKQKCLSGFGMEI